MSVLLHRSRGARAGAETQPTQSAETQPTRSAQPRQAARPADPTDPTGTDRVEPGTGQMPMSYRRPVGAALIGLVALVVGAWAALVGYIGPYFDYRPVATHTWVASLQNGLLHLLPGAVGAAAGIMLLMLGPARRVALSRALMLPAVMLVLAGAWLVIGPWAWPTFEHSSAFVAAATANRTLLDVACASLAPGLVLAILGGMALKAGMVPPVLVHDPYTPAEAAPGSAHTAAAPAAAAQPGAAAQTPAETTQAVPTPQAFPTTGQGLVRVDAPPARGID